MRHLKSIVAVIGAATVLVLAGNTVALATTGHSFILGHSNYANKQTTLARTTGGTALRVATKYASNSPFSVNGKGKVTNLNADTVDGYDSTSLRTSSYSWTKNVTTAVGSADLTVAPPAGAYVVGYGAHLGNGGAASSDAGCFVYRLHAGNYTYYAEERQPTAAGDTPSFSGSDLVSVAAGDTLTLHCYAPAPFTTTVNEPIRLYATRTSIIGGAALRVASPGARATH